MQTAKLFDPLNRLTQTCSATSSPACSAGTRLSSFAYTLGLAGNRTAAAELPSGRNVAYGYDADYVLTSETITGDPPPASNNGSETYTYDVVGNRKTLTSTVPALPGNQTFSYDSNDRLTTDTIDNNGNTTLSGGVSNTYDFENRMTAHGTTTKYLVDTLNPTQLPQVLDETVNGGVTRTYAYGLQRISENQLNGSTWTPSFYGYDGHANVRFLTNSAGTVTDTYQYDAFGRLITTSGSTPNNYFYSGEWSDSIGLYNLRARYYNQATGRFWTRDAVEGKLTDANTLHKYLYASGNPVNRVDPLGQVDSFEYDSERVVIRFAEHGLDHLVEEGLELTQPEVEAYIEQSVREFLAENKVFVGWQFDIPFVLSQLNNVPWVYRIYIVSSALVSVSTYFPPPSP